MNRRATFRWLLAGFFITAGANHFHDPDFYLSAMPSWLPWQRTLIDLSGGAEILGGAGVLVPLTRRAAGWGLIALLAAVFPANLNMALRDVRPPARYVDERLLWARLPIQVVLVAWVWWTAASEAA